MMDVPRGMRFAVTPAGMIWMKADAVDDEVNELLMVMLKMS